MGKLTLAWLSFAALAAGCNPNPYCLNCNTRDLAGMGDLATAGDMATMPDGPGPMPDLVDTDGACVPSGPEKCDTIDNDCNGMVDDVPAMQLEKDPNNCGKCGTVCSYVNAFGQCAGGMCTMGACQPGHYDLDKNAMNGCEYDCIPANPPMEVCDGKDNDCNGTIDEGFNLMTDAAHCGACGNACAFPNANGQCMGGKCSVSTCKPGFIDLDKNGANGCEYACVPANPPTEKCNGKDDDCNGMIDDNPNDVGVACDQFCPPLAACTMNNSCAFPRSMCVGRCCGICTQGRTICAGGQPVCQMGMGPQLEVCNNRDDNCDGQIDEGFNLQSDPLNCGMCGRSCAVPNAVASCTNGSCSVLNCRAGFADLDKNPANGCEYTCPVNPSTVESCNGRDDDCNGMVDDGLVAPNNFCNQQSICAGSRPICGAARGWICNYAQVNPNIEVDMNGNLRLSETLCDQFDGNCNTQVDEAFSNKGRPCSVGTGSCQGNALFVCSMDKLSTVCPAMDNPMAAVDEVCNGVDDNCDGQVDERTPRMGSTCYNGGQHNCLGWRDPMVRVGNVYVYQHEASHPDATAMVVGSNTSRACAKAGVLPWAPVNWNQAVAACAAIRDSANAPMRLCTAPEWTTACNLGMNSGQIWSYATNPTTYQAMVCNGYDRMLGQAWTTGAGASCYANQGMGRIYDMSGNVGEWTSTLVTVNNQQYYKVRGGSYNNFATGINCNFDFTIERPNYQFNNLGFRCCSDNAP